MTANGEIVKCSITAWTACFRSEPALPFTVDLVIVGGNVVSVLDVISF